MADPLPPTVRAFMIRTGRTTAAEADTKGMGVLDDLPVMDAVAIYCMCKSAEKRDNLTAQKAALLVANEEMQKNNLSIQNWKERGMIAASTTWPTDQDSIDELIALFDSDTDIPGPPTEDPPIQQDATREAIEASRDLNKEIRDKLADAAAAGGTVPFTTDRELAQSFSAWLERHGVEPSHASDKVSFDGTNYFDKSEFTTPFETPKTPAFTVLPDGATKYWLGNVGSRGTVLEPATAVTGLGLFMGSDLRDGYNLFGEYGFQYIDMSLFPVSDGSTLKGRIYVNGSNNDHFFFVPQGNTLPTTEQYNYTPPPLLPANLGIEVDTDGDGTTDQRIWSNGVNFYDVDGSSLTKTWLADGGAAGILDGIQEGTPYVGFAAGGGPLYQIQPKDSYIANPSPAERGDWAIHFDDQIDKFQANNNLWSAQSGAQQVRMQDDVAQYASLLGITSNMTQNNGRMLERLLPGR